MIAYTTISKTLTRVAVLTVLMVSLGAKKSRAQGIYIDNGATFAAVDATIGFHGDINNDGTLSIEGGRTVLGSGVNEIKGNNGIEIDTLVLKMGASTTLETEVVVKRHLAFNSGVIKTDINNTSDYIHFANGANYSGASNSSYVQGRVKKTGNEAFTFPVGDSLDLQAISISAPDNATDAFTAMYVRGDASDAGFSTNAINSTCGTDVVVRDVSEKEFWSLFRDAGTSDVTITFDFDGNSEIVNLSKLLVMNWNGTEWTSMGNAGTTGTNMNGTITAGPDCETGLTGFFGYFTFGGADLNTLPIELISFTGEGADCAVELAWTIEADGDLSHFEIQRSTNGSDFETIETIYDNTTTAKSYTFIDANPVSDSYYRLVSVDIFGEADHSELIYIQTACEDVYPMTVYPTVTTANSVVAVDFYGTGEEMTFDIYDLSGQKVKRVRKAATNGASTVSIELDEMAAGQYILALVETGETQRIVIQ